MNTKNKTEVRETATQAGRLKRVVMLLIGDKPKITIGFFLIAFGFLGGFSILEDLTGWKTINELSKDQVCLCFGFTWYVLGR